jgi:hypothetical protein
MENCTCPACRYSRGEISKEALAWYYKGSIEAATRTLKCHDEEPENSAISWKSIIRYELDCDKMALEELLKRDFKDEMPDKALLQPENYVLKDKDEK